MYSRFTPVVPVLITPVGHSFSDARGWTDICETGTGPVELVMTLDDMTWSSTVEYFAVSLTASTEYTFYGTGTYSNAKISVYNEAGTVVAFNTGAYQEEEPYAYIMPDVVWTCTVTGTYIVTFSIGNEMMAEDTYAAYISPRPATLSMIRYSAYGNSTCFNTDGIIERHRSAADVQLRPFIPQTGLVFYAPLDVDATAVTGQSIQSTTSSFGVYQGVPSASFNGTEYIHYPDSAALPSGNAARTISLWVNATGEIQTGRALICYGGGTAPGVGIQLSLSGNELWGSSMGATNDIRTTFAPFLNMWYHMVMVVYDIYDVRFYVDGILAGTGAFTSLNTGVGFIIIGASGGMDSYFYGRVAGVRVYSRALSDVEIVRLSKEFVPTA